MYGTLSAWQLLLLNRPIALLQDISAAILAAPTDWIKASKSTFGKQMRGFKELPAQVSIEFDNVFRFCDEEFTGGQETMILVTELTVNLNTAHFLTAYGYKEYFAHNKDLLFYQQRTELIDKIDALAASAEL